MLNAVTEESRIIPASGVALLADVGVPAQVIGLIVFVHGSGSGRRSPRNRRVATALQQAGFATVLIDLLSGEEAVRDELDYSLRFDIDLLSRRVEAVVDWLAATPSLADLPLGLYGASTGAATGPLPWPLSCHGAAGPISRAAPCRWCRRPQCSSSAATISSCWT
jgi:dienelactone hydrolase